MTPPLLIREFLGTLIALELSVVQSLHHKTFDMISQVQICSAVWTRALAHLPLLNASIASKLFALLTLLRLFDYNAADNASEIRIKVCRMPTNLASVCQYLRPSSLQR